MKHRKTKEKTERQPLKIREAKYLSPESGGEEEEDILKISPSIL